MGLSKYARRVGDLVNINKDMSILLQTLSNEFASFLPLSTSTIDTHPCARKSLLLPKSEVCQGSASVSNTPLIAWFGFSRPYDVKDNLHMSGRG